MSINETDITVGFIGAGNMASAMINGILNKKLIKPHHILVSDTDCAKISALKEATGVTIASDNRALAKDASIIIIAVKPAVYSLVLDEIFDLLSSRHIIVSIAPGLTTGFLSDKVKGKCKVVRTMPNIACLVQEGMTVICANHGLNETELNAVLGIMSSFGKVEIADESIIDAITAVSGSSPAFVCIFIEALADAGVMMGIPREQAYRLASHTVSGSAKMVINTNKHPAELKDMVCTPGGTTIQGIYSLEMNGFRGAVIDAVRSSALKAREMSK